MTPRFSSPQGPAHRIVLQVGRDHVVTRLDQALDRQVQPIGAIVSEDPSLGPLAAEKLIEPMPGVIEHPFRRQSHAMPRTSGVGQAGARESVECLIDGLRFGKAGGGVVEVDHGRIQGSAVGSSVWRRRMADGRWQMARWQDGKMANGT